MIAKKWHIQKYLLNLHYAGFWQTSSLILHTGKQIMAKTYFNRYVWLLDTIMQHGHITLTDINDLWCRSALNEDGTPLPPRTFHNHREAILDTFGIEIKFDKTLGYFISNEDMNEGGIRSWLMTSLSVNNLINESASLRDRIILENIPSGEQYLKQIINAMKEGKMLEMEYRKFEDLQNSRVIIAPYCVKLFKQRWYVVGKPSDKREPRIYALDRVQGLLQTRREFKVPEKFDAEKYFTNWFGIVHDEINYKPETVRLKVWDRQRHYFRTLKLHHSQYEEETHGDWSVFRYFMAPTWDLEQELLQLNDCVEVLEPQSLRERMMEHIDNMKAVYDGKYNEQTV